MEEHQGRKKPSEVPCYINNLVGSMTKVLLCCWTIEWIIYSYPPRLAIKQLTTLKITKKGPFTKTACLNMAFKKIIILFSKRGKYIILFTAKSFKATIQGWNFSQLTHVRYLHFGGSYIVWDCQKKLLNFTAQYHNWSTRKCQSLSTLKVLKFRKE